MLSPEMYSAEYIRDLRSKTGCDPLLLERVIFAFGLLESVVKTGMPFCFKGGTSLMLLLDRPRRLSTDIDIVVKPGTDINAFIEKAGKVFPFISAEEVFRNGNNKIEKRHFKFKYRSPVSDHYVPVLLDVVFEEQLFSRLERRPIRNEYLLTEGDDLTVVTPGTYGICSSYNRNLR